MSAAVCVWALRADSPVDVAVPAAYLSTDDGEVVAGYLKCFRLVQGGARVLHVAGPYIRDGKVAVAAGVLVVVYQGFLVEGYRLGVILQVEGAFPGEGVNVRRRNVALLVLELLPGYPAGFVREVVVVVFQALF